MFAKVFIKLGQELSLGLDLTLFYFSHNKNKGIKRDKKNHKPNLTERSVLLVLNFLHRLNSTKLSEAMRMSEHM